MRAGPHLIPGEHGRAGERSAALPRGARGTGDASGSEPSPGKLNDSPVEDDAVLGDDDDPLPDEVTVAVFLLDAGLVDDPDVAADPGVLVDDGVFDDCLRSDAHRRDAAGDGRLHVGQRLVEVSADEQAVADAALGADAAADADDGPNQSRRRAGCTPRR